MRRSPIVNSPVQKGDRHARVAEPIPRSMVLQVSRSVGAEVPETGDLWDVATWIGRILRQLCERHGVELLEGHALADHVHLLLSIPPKYSVANTIGRLKGKSAILIHRRHLGQRRNFTGFHFWSRGYCVSTVGLDEKLIRAYIRNQEAEEERQEKSLFEGL